MEMIKSMVPFGIILYVVVQLSSCVTQPTRPRKISKAEKIIKCIEYFTNEDADFQEKMQACTMIYERKSSNNLKE